MQQSSLFCSWSLSTLVVLLLASTFQPLDFLITPAAAFVPNHVTFTRKARLVTSTQQWDGGYGIADTYSWKEDAFEIEITVKVPGSTKTRDVKFTPTPRSIDLRLIPQPNKVVPTKGKGKQNQNTTATTADSTEIVLLDGSRPLRGRVNLDGTYWVIADPDQEDRKKDSNVDYRLITVTIEKLIRTPRNDFEVINYDWKGVYTNDTAEVLERHYPEPEKLNVREYAASLGVDIDNINMSMVDKTMFSSGVNLTKNSMDELTKAGYLNPKEITRQADGTEYEMDEDGLPTRVNAFDDDDNSNEEDARQEQEISQRPKPQQQQKKPIPFLDTNSPWHTAVPVVVDPESNQTVVQLTRNFTRAAFAQDSTVNKNIASNEDDEDDIEGQDGSDQKSNNNKKDVMDPIDMLTVKRLKEILKSQGLKTTGNKEELQSRLRRQVNALLQGQQDPPKES